MDNATCCLFCSTPFNVGDSRSRKFCTVCLPPLRTSTKSEYSKRYNDLYRACGLHPNGGPPASRLPLDHPATFVKCEYRGCEALSPRRKSGSQRKFCSQKCKDREKYLRRIGAESLRGRVPVGGECGWCFKNFEREVNAGAAEFNSRFCSNECATNARGNVQTHRSPNSCPLPVCIDCCQVFGASPMGTGRWSDGNRCAECLKTNGDNVSRRHAARRAGDRPTVAKLAERDGAVCGLCHGPVDMSLTGHAWQGPTVDHIVPISLGGTDTMDNTQLAHRSCNVRRNVKPVEEFQPCPESSRLFVN